MTDLRPVMKIYTRSNAGEAISGPMVKHRATAWTIEEWEGPAPVTRAGRRRAGERLKGMEGAEPNGAHANAQA
jgi:hypothetical protein